MSARLLTGYDLQKYVAKRNAMLDIARAERRQCDELPAFEAHLARHREVDPGVFVWDRAIVAGDDRREVCKLAVAQGFPNMGLYFAPNDLFYLGEVIKRINGQIIVHSNDGRKEAA
jgi:hypothetical protein